MDAIAGSTIPALESSLRFRLVRQGLLAANLANADTPGYRRVNASFDAALTRAGHELTRTHPAHQAHPDGPAGYRIERGPRGSGPDGNGVELQREILEASRNAGAFTKQAAVLSRLLILRRIAITGDR